MTESATPESGALTVEQAIASLAPEPVEQEASSPQWGDAINAMDPDAPGSGGEETEGEASSPDEAEDGAETPAEDAEAEAEPEAVEPVEPPKYWSKDAKEAFAKLPADLQAVVLQQEGPREEAAAKAKAEAAELSQKAQAEMGKVQQFAELLGDNLSKWVQTFQSRWGTQTPDWVAYAQEHGVETMTLAKAQFEAEQSQLAEAAQAQQVAQAQARDAYVNAELAKLRKDAPELATPEKGNQIAQYLAKAGYPAEALANISAADMMLAHKAMLWDEAQAKAKAAPKPKPAAPAAKAAPVRPAAAAPASSPARTAANRFAQTRSIDDAVALLLAPKGR